MIVKCKQEDNFLLCLQWIMDIMMKSEKTPWLSGTICGWDVKVYWKMVTFTKWGDKCAFEFETLGARWDLGYFS